MTHQFFSMLTITTLVIISAVVFPAGNAKAQAWGMADYMNEDRVLRAVWMGVTVAEARSSQVQNVEGNVYFPPNTVQWEYLVANEQPCSCPWKGPCVYYDVEVDGQVNPSAAWVYQMPFPAAEHITWHAAFSNGITVE